MLLLLLLLLLLPDACGSWVWAPMGWVHGLQLGFDDTSIPFHPGVWKAPREAFRTTNRFFNMLWRMWTESSCSEASDPNTCTSMLFARPLPLPSFPSANAHAIPDTGTNIARRRMTAWCTATDLSTPQSLCQSSLLWPTSSSMQHARNEATIPVARGAPSICCLTRPFSCRHRCGHKIFRLKSGTTVTTGERPVVMCCVVCRHALTRALHSLGSILPTLDLCFAQVIASNPLRSTLFGSGTPFSGR